MNGSAPNSPATGSQISVRQKLKPNFRIDGSDWRVSSTPIANTIRTTTSATAPVPIRKVKSRDRSVIFFGAPGAHPGARRARGVNRSRVSRTERQLVLTLASAASSSFTTSGGSGAYPSSAQYFWPSPSAHLRKSTMTWLCALSLGFSYSRSHVNDEMGYTPFPGAFVIDTRKSGGICLAAADAATVTDSTDALTSSPDMFCTGP